MEYKEKIIIFGQLFIVINSLLNFPFSNQFYDEYKINIPFSDKELDYFNINKKNFTICEQWIPSLFNPIFLLPYDIDTKKYEKITNINFNLICPVISEENLQINLLNYSDYNITFAKIRFDEGIVKNCYFGLNFAFGDYNSILNYSKNILSQLKDINKIKKKIFSFKKWKINKDSINTSLYIGDSHDNFIVKNENATIGSCKLNTTYPYWGCFFKGMSFRNSYTDLINDKNNNSYNVYFSSENYQILFPESFKSKFDKITNNSCVLTEEEAINNYGLRCENFFDKDNYTTIELITDEMNITVEIDNLNRFSEGDPKKKNITRIKYRNIDYFIFPLIMFKQFHIQFDAEDNLTSFYTTDQSILKVKKDDKQKKDKHSSNASTIFLIIFIILLIVVLVFGVFWFIKKRKNSVEKNINKYNKFEDEDNFKDMNEKRVF